MKTIFSLLLLVLITSCDSPKRAGSYYNPKFYSDMRTETQKVPVVKDEDIIKKYHSALGHLCTRYRSNQQDTVICDDGNTENSVRVLQ